MLEKASVIYLGALGALTWFISIIAPGAETQFKTLLLVITLWLFTSLLRKLSKRLPDEPFKVDVIYQLAGIFAAIKFSAEASKLMLGMDDAAAAQLLIIGFIAFYSLKFIINLTYLGVPIPTSWVDKLVGKLPDNKVSDETLEKLNMLERGFTSKEKDKEVD